MSIRDSGYCSGCCRLRCSPDSLAHTATKLGHACVESRRGAHSLAVTRTLFRQHRVLSAFSMQQRGEGLFYNGPEYYTCARCSACDQRLCWPWGSCSGVHAVPRESLRDPNVDEGRSSGAVILPALGFCAIASGSIPNERRFAAIRCVRQSCRSNVSRCRGSPDPQFLGPLTMRSWTDRVAAGARRACRVCCRSSRPRRSCSCGRH